MLALLSETQHRKVFSGQRKKDLVDVKTHLKQIRDFYCCFPTHHFIGFVLIKH